MIDWIQDHETILWWLAGLSIVTFVGTLIVVPLVVIRIPPDYFAHRKRHRTRWASQHPVVRVILRVSKNTLGGVFIVVGIAMLVLPGQGLLTVLIGIMVTDFPGKYGFERWLVARGPVLRSINWLRRCARRPPLVVWQRGAGEAAA